MTVAELPILHLFYYPLMVCVDRRSFMFWRLKNVYIRGLQPFFVWELFF